MFDKASYKIYTDKIVYEPINMTTQKAIKMAGRISAFEDLPVYLYHNNMIMCIKVAKLDIQRIK